MAIAASVECKEGVVGNELLETKVGSSIQSFLIPTLPSKLSPALPSSLCEVMRMSMRMSMSMCMSVGEERIKGKREEGMEGGMDLVCVPVSGDG